MLVSPRYFGILFCKMAAARIRLFTIGGILLTLGVCVYVAWWSSAQHLLQGQLSCPPGQSACGLSCCPVGYCVGGSCIQGGAGGGGRCPRNRPRCTQRPTQNPSRGRR